MRGHDNILDRFFMNVFICIHLCNLGRVPGVPPILDIYLHGSVVDIGCRLSSIHQRRLAQISVPS
jgi:hypothetical protein